MRHPVWIVNSVLFFLFIVVLCFVLLSKPEIPERESIEVEPGEHSKPLQPKGSEINIEQIYKKDLFDTYIAAPILEPQKEEVIQPLPEPPAPQVPPPPVKPKPQFLEPLGITLKGIMIISKDDTKNKAIIADNKTKKELVFKMGDMIEDAHLIKIFRNKVIFLRSNGQQEVIYLRQQDAQLDPTFALLRGWDVVVKPITQGVYLVNSDEFSMRVNNLAHFIDLLELTTAYQKGNKIGCKVGGIEANSLGAALGFEPGDIILAVNNIPATDSANRLRIYGEVIKLHDTTTNIIVQLLRNNSNMMLTYTFGKEKPKLTSAQMEQMGKEKAEKRKKEAAHSVEDLQKKLVELKQEAAAPSEPPAAPQAAEEQKEQTPAQEVQQPEQQTTAPAEESETENAVPESDTQEVAVTINKREQKAKPTKVYGLDNEATTKMAQQRKRLDPTIREQRMRERRNMLQKARPPFKADSPTLLSSRHDKKI